MDDNETTARSRALGAALRRIREDTGRSMTEVAQSLGCSVSWVSRLESGSRGTPLVELAALLGFYGVTGSRFDELLELSRHATLPTWLQPHPGQPVDALPSVRLLESTAHAITGYAPWVIPALLQTEDYARALLDNTPWIDTEDVEHHVEARVARQRLVHDQPTPILTHYIAERTLRTPVGGPRVMVEQLLHLALVAGHDRRVVRVVSDWPRGGPFQVLTYVKHRPLVYLDTLAATMSFEDPATVATYDAILDDLATTAAESDASRELITRLADTYETESAETAGRV